MEIVCYAELRQDLLIEKTADGRIFLKEVSEWGVAVVAGAPTPSGGQVRSGAGDSVAWRLRMLLCG